MKKWWIAMAVAMACCFTGCQAPSNSNSESESSTESESSSAVESDSSIFGSQSGGELGGLTKMETPYTAENMGEILFTDVEKSLTIDVSENEYLKTWLPVIEYFAPADGTIDEEMSVAYTLSLQGVELKISSADSGAVCFVLADGETKLAVAAAGTFSYLETLISGEVTTIQGYTASYNIQVYNAENEGGGVKNKATFLQELQEVQLVKLGNIEHYQLGEKTYTVGLGRDEMLVYSKYVVYKGELYSIYQGDFGFLRDVEFSEEGEWLPWV